MKLSDTSAALALTPICVLLGFLFYVNATIPLEMDVHKIRKAEIDLAYMDKQVKIKELELEIKKARLAELEMVDALAYVRGE